MDLSSVGDRTIRNVRKHFHMIFQDPYSSLNPTMTVLELVKEPLIYNGIATGERANELVFSVLEEVGLEKNMLTGTLMLSAVVNGNELVLRDL